MVLLLFTHAFSQLISIPFSVINSLRIIYGQKLLKHNIINLRLVLESMRTTESSLHYKMGNTDKLFPNVLVNRYLPPM